MTAMTSIGNNQGTRSRVSGWWTAWRLRAAARAASRARADVEVACMTYGMGFGAGTAGPAKLSRHAMPRRHTS